MPPAFAEDEFLPSLREEIEPAGSFTQRFLGRPLFRIVVVDAPPFEDGAVVIIDRHRTDGAEPPFAIGTAEIQCRWKAS